MHAPMPQPPSATDPHAFPFCARCGAYRHQGLCPQPLPLPPPPSASGSGSGSASIAPLSAAFAAAPRSSPAAPPPPSATPSVAYTVPRDPRRAAAPSEPAAPRPNPLEPSVRQIVLGAALIGLGAWLLLSALPAHRPMSSVEAVAYLASQARQQEAPVTWMFRPAAYYGLCVFSALLALAGLEKLLRGCLRRSFALTSCRHCNVRVWARRSGSQLLCPNGGHLTHLSRAARLALTVLFVFLALGVLSYVLKASH